MSLRPSCLLVLVLAVVTPVRGQPPAPPAPEPPASRAGSAVWLGVLLGDAVDGGVQILDVVADGPAYRSGLAAGDIVIRVDDAEVPDRDALRRALAGLRPGRSAALTLLRDGRRMSATIVPAAAPASATLWRLPPEVTGPAPTGPGGFPSGAADALGVTLESVPAELRTHLGGGPEAGVLVTRVDADLPAADLLKPGDLVVRVLGVPVASREAFDAAARDHLGGTIAVDAVRRGQPFSVAIVTAPRSPEGLARDRRIRALEAAIEQLEGTLDGLRRELARLKARDR